jgi:hypothetical protein
MSEDLYVVVLRTSATNGTANFVFFLVEKIFNYIDRQSQSVSVTQDEVL